MKAILPNPDFIVWTGYVHGSVCVYVTFVYLNIYFLTVYVTCVTLVLFNMARDDTPHVPNENLGEEAVLSIISNLTSIINQVFPSMCQ